MSEDDEDNSEPAEVRKARRIGEKVSPKDVCGHCARAPDGSTHNGESIIRDLKELAGYRIDESGNLKPPSVERLEFLRRNIYPAFRKAYFRNCSEPVDCTVCRDFQIECFHEKYGIEGFCPGTSGTPEVR